MNEELKNSVKQATGLFALKANENNQGEHDVPTRRHVLDLTQDGLQIFGYESGDLRSHGADIFIKGLVKAGETYAFKPDVVGGNYNPKEWTGRSWNGLGGEVKIDAVDVDSQTVKGSFTFTARPLDNSQVAVISGTFNLKN
ncbi:hypothetical protein [Pseudomonas sp. PB106]|uniref:hypothetical protein n=1 Tax=Pseudomonas sp. PB106 TaxID=2494699 RepID=UPI00131DF50A|nr:hypothetical protein [Pseudomonas sp. PB106]KAE9646499.1 hypothetical protein EJA71_09215 [Pseudomonas sp. PB106]